MVTRSDAAARISGPGAARLLEAASCRLRRDRAGRWHIAAASDRFLEMIGRRRDTVIGADPAALLGLDEESLDRQVQAVSPEALETEIALQLPRRPSTLDTTLVPLPTAGDAPSEILALFRRPQAARGEIVDRPIAASEAPVDLFVRYSTDLVFLDCSESYAALYGTTPAELIGRNVADWVPREVLPHIQRAIRQIGPQKIANTHEAHRQLPDGSYRWYRWIEISPPSANGQTREMIAVGVDVTALKEAQAQLRDAIDSINEGFCLFDPDKRLVQFNEQFRQMYPKTAPVIRPGITMTDLLREAAANDELGQGDNPEQVAQDIEQRILGSDRVSYERQLADGRWILISQRATAEGGYVGIRTDITAVKEKEQALQRIRDELEAKNAELVTLTEQLKSARLAAEENSRAKSRFLAHMSHELRTPLNGILGFAEIISSGLFGPVQPSRYQEYSELIHSNGKLLLSLINDILDMSKIEAGKMELAIEPHAIEPLAESCRAMMAGLARDNAVVLKVAIDPDCRQILADARAAKQMILNLVSNAIKFTPAGGTVTIGFADLGSEGIEIAVTDTGIGMTPEELKKAMQPFGQIDSELALQHRGTGIGLSLVKSLAELHGGTLLMTSEKGRGTRAAILLPK